MCILLETAVRVPTIRQPFWAADCRAKWNLHRSNFEAVAARAEDSGFYLTGMESARSLQCLSAAALSLASSPSPANFIDIASSTF